MPISSNEGGVLYELEIVNANENGVIFELDSVHANEGGVLYEIFSAWAMPASPTWKYFDIYMPSSSGPPSKVGTSSGTVTISETTWTMTLLKGMAVANFTLSSKTKITITITKSVTGNNQWRNEVQIGSGHTTSSSYTLEGGAYANSYAKNTSGTSYTTSKVLTKEYTLDKGDYHIVCACGMAVGKGDAGSANNSSTEITSISAIMPGNGMNFNVAFEKA